MKSFKLHVLSILLLLGGIGISHAQTYTFSGLVPNDDRWFAELFDDSVPPNLIATNWNSLSIPNSPNHDAIVNSNHAQLATRDVQLNSLTVGSSGSLLIRRNMQLFGNLPLTNQGSIVFRTRGDVAFSFSNNFVNSGTFEVDSEQAGPASLMLTNAGATLQGGGRIILKDVNASTINGTPGGLLTIADQTIEGAGFIGGDNLEIINTANGLITANLAIGWRIVIDAGSGGFLNEGIVQAENGGTLRFFDSIVDNNNGTILSDVGSEIELWDATIIGGSLTGGGEFRTVSGTSTLEDVDFESTLFVGSSDTLEVAGTLNNSGYIETHSQNGKMSVSKGGATLEGGGTISLEDEFIGPTGETLTIADQTILLSEAGNDLGNDSINVINTTGGVIEADDVSSTIDPFGTSPWTNDGTVRMATERSVTLNIQQSVVNNGIMDAQGGTIWVNGDSLTSTADSVMMGGGTFRSNDEINLGGTVAPGNSAGELTLNGNVAFTSSADLQIELADVTSFDLLSIVNSDPVVLDGILNVFLLDGFIPAATDSFVIVDANATLSGAFSNVASGSRLTTSDGIGSFEVTYGGGMTTVVLSDFEPTIPLDATSMTVVRGIQTGGTVADLATSDNVDVAVQRNPAQTSGIVEIELQSTTTVLNPSAFVFSVEASAFFRSSIIESVEFWDYDAGEYVEIDSRPASRFADSVETAIGSGDLSRFVDDNSGEVRARILYTSSVRRQAFSVAVDHVFWLIN